VRAAFSFFMFAGPGAMKNLLLVNLILLLFACEKHEAGTLLDNTWWVPEKFTVDGHDSTEAILSGTCDGGPWTFEDSGRVVYLLHSHPCIAGGTYAFEENNKILTINMASSGFGGSVEAYKANGEARWHVLYFSRVYLILTVDYNGRNNMLWFRRTAKY
jgi:hypothetical protein